MKLRKKKPEGFWLCYYSDWSGIAIFDNELDAQRYACDSGMICEWRTWGAVR